MSDIERIRREVSLVALAQDHGVSLKKNGGEHSGLCPFHNETTPSFTIFTGKDGVERFNCFGCGAQGDAIDFVENARGLSRRDAIRMLAGEDVQAGPVRRREALPPVDPYAEIELLEPVNRIHLGHETRIYNPKTGKWSHFRASGVWPYYREGRLLGYVLRRDIDGKKETPQVCWVRLPDGTECWSRFPFPKPRPLYVGGGLSGIPEGQVVIVEGEKCADALYRQRRRALTWVGGTNGVAHADWSLIGARDVIIWPDADQPGVTAANEIARILIEQGCRVRVMDVSGKPDGWDCADAIDEGWGFDAVTAFIKDRVREFRPDDEPPPAPPPPPEPKRRSFEDIHRDANDASLSDEDGMRALLLEASELSVVQRDAVLKAIKGATGATIQTLKQMMRAEENGGEEEKLDHLTLARKAITRIGAQNIICAGPFVWMWSQTGVWQQQEDRLVKQRIQQTIEAIGMPVQSALVTGVAETMKNEIFRDRHRFNVGPHDAVNCLNGEIVLEGGEWVLRPHVREHYRTTQIPVEFDPDAEAPLFLQFLDSIFAGDADAVEKQQALLEVLGYTLMSHALHEIFVILIGAGGNGKSVILHVINCLCGPENVAGVQPSNFDRSFQRAHLDQKLANIVTEIAQGEVIADAELKGIVSGERSTVEHKFQDPFDMHPFATCWFGTNHMPHTRDFSDALFRRALILKFNRTFAKHEQDPNLKLKLEQELPGILNLALRAYARALERGFTHPVSSEQAKAEWRLEADQVAAFVEECCTKQIGWKESAGALFSEYQKWAGENGISKTMSAKGMRDRLTRLGFGQARDSNGRYVTGIRLGGGYVSDTVDF